jgi:hypothetical protein
MALPRAVREAGKRSDELSKQLQEEGKTGENDTPAAANNGPDLSGVLNKPEGEGADGKTAEDPNIRPAPTQETVNPPLQDDGFKHKYDVLQAKYNAEVPGLHRQIKALQESIAELKKQIETPASSTTEDGAGNTPGLDEDEYPPELVAVINKQDKQIAELMSTINQLTGNVENIRSETTATKSDAFWNDLIKAVPDWESINVSQKFLVWLGQPDPLTGIIRQNLVDQAQKNLDAARLIAVFNDWKSQKPQSGQGQPNLEDEVIPNNSQGNGPGAPEKPVYTRAWVSKFYQDKAAGKSQYTEEQHAQIDRDIIAAQSEGRIQG